MAVRLSVCYTMIFLLCSVVFYCVGLCFVVLCDVVSFTHVRVCVYMCAYVRLRMGSV